MCNYQALSNASHKPMLRGDEIEDCSTFTKEGKSQQTKIEKCMFNNQQPKEYRICLQKLRGIIVLDIDSYPRAYA